MKKLIILISLLILSATRGTAQEYYPGDDGNSIIRIPVVFHVVYKNNALKEYINKELLTDIVERINNNFNHVNPTNIYLPYQNRVAQCNIEFYIPDEAYDENGNIKPGISYHYSDKEYYVLDGGIFYTPYDKELKSKGYINSRRYLNIWIANLVGIKYFNIDILAEKDDGDKGYSTFPKEKKQKNDGIVIDDELFYHYKSGILTKTDPQYAANIITHEMGHWLGLYHIWGKYKKNEKCKYDDEVSDTPKQKGPNKGDFYGKFFDEMLPTCENPNIKSNYQNFMDYTYHKYSMFTEGQKKKMRYNIYKHRAELLYNSYDNSTISDGSSQNDEYNISYEKKYLIINMPEKFNYKVYVSNFHNSKYDNLLLKNNVKNELLPGRYLIEIYDESKYNREVIAEIILGFDGTRNIIFETSEDGCVFWRYEDENVLRKFNYMYGYYHCRDVEHYLNYKASNNISSTQQTDNYSSQNKNASSYNSQDNVLRPATQSNKNHTYNGKLRPATSAQPGHSANTDNNKAAEKFVRQRTLNTIRRKTNNQVPVEVKTIQKQSTPRRLNSPSKRNIQRPKPLNRPRTNTYNRKVTRPQSRTPRFPNQSTKPYTRTRPRTRSTKPLSRTTRAQPRKPRTSSGSIRNIYRPRSSRTKTGTKRTSSVKTRRGASTRSKKTGSKPNVYKPVRKKSKKTSKLLRKR